MPVVGEWLGVGPFSTIQENDGITRAIYEIQQFTQMLFWN